MLKNNKSILEEILFFLAKTHKITVTLEGDVFVIGCSAFICREGAWIDAKTPRIMYEEYMARGINLYQLHSVPAMKLRNYIMSKIGLHPVVYARQCKIVDITQLQYAEILEKYHIQSATRSHIKYALEFEDKIVGAIGFIRDRGTFNLNRLVFSNVRVVGGASKLLSHFRKTNDNKIITYSNNGYSNGNVYNKLGFTNTNEETRDMWYVDPTGKLVNRRSFQKKNLHKIFGDVDLSKTEIQIMADNGYGVYVGPGTKRWEL